MTQTSLIRPFRQFTLPQKFRDYEATEQFRQLPLKIQQFFQHLEHIIQNSDQNGFKEEENSKQKANNNIQTLNFMLCSAFKRLSQNEQIAFMQQVISELKAKSSSNPAQIAFSQGIRQYLCSIRINSYCLSHWNNILLKLNKNRKTVTLQIKDRAIDVYLKEYLLRKSKVHSLCLVLENIGFAAKNKQYIYHIRFEEKEAEAYAQLQSSIKRIIVQSQVQSLLLHINQQKNMKLALSKCRGQIFLFLSQKNIHKFHEIQQYFENESRGSVVAKQSQKFSQQTSIKASSEDEGYYEVSSLENCKVQVSKNNENLYRAHYRLKQGLFDFTRSFVDSYKKQHKMVFRLKVLQQKQGNIPQGLMRYVAFYQKIVWKQKIFGQLFIAKQQGLEQQGERSNLQTFKVSFINIDDKNNRNFVQFVQITVKQITRTDLQIKLLAKFMPAFESQAVELYLHQFFDVFEGKNNVGSSMVAGTIKEEALQKLFPEMATQKLQSNQYQYQSRQRSLISQRQKQLSQPLKQNINNQIDLLFSDNFNERQKEAEEKRVTVSKAYLKHRYPLGVVRKKGKIMKEHFLWSNWRRAQKGGLVCKNEQLVERQKKMFKLILKKFGETLLMGKNIINFSLPVVVFKKQSHLQSLAKSYLYSPIFTERAAGISDPLERIKFSVVLMITENALSIHMEKPFNPILGETYQGWINGCPIYLQQVSHHPPTSAYYFIGRGYKKYGCIEPKISVGLNTGSGYSLFPHFVQFDDGMKIEYICAKIVIGGLLIGERTFNFEDKIYAYDRKHRYFASVKFGPVNRGFFSSSNEPQDYFYGQIYEVTAEFEHYFDKEKGIKPHPQEQHIVKKLSYFDGIWNSFVNVNGEEVLNFKTDLPYEFEEEAMPLPSDSKYREDLSNLLAGDLEAAQIAKEEMEEAQRRDRRLREEHEK